MYSMRHILSAGDDDIRANCVICCLNINYGSCELKFQEYLNNSTTRDRNNLGKDLFYFKIRRK